MELNKDQVLETLGNVRHPESQEDIVSLGIVDNIVIDGNKVSFDLVFKKQNDPFE